jgi:hypothetical protein
MPAAPQSRFSQEAIRHTIFPATHNAAQTGLTSQPVAAPGAVAKSRSGAIKGAAIGATIGAVLGWKMRAINCLHEPKWHCAAKGGVSIGAVGALIGWLR